MLKLLIKPESLRGKLERRGIFLPLALLIIALMLLKAAETLPIFTGMPPTEHTLILGSRETGTRFVIPYYLPVFVPLISVPVITLIDSFLLYLLSRLLKGAQFAYGEFYRVFIWLSQVKTLEYVILFVLKAVFKLNSISFSIYSGHIDLFSLWLLFNLAFYMGDGKERYKLLGGYFLSYLIIEGISMLGAK